MAGLRASAKFFRCSLNEAVLFLTDQELLAGGVVFEMYREKLLDTDGAVSGPW